MSAEDEVVEEEEEDDMDEEGTTKATIEFTTVKQQRTLKANN